MLPHLLRPAALLFAALLLVAPAAAADATRGLPLPPGSRAADADTFSSSRGFRDTVTFYSRHLHRRDIPHRAIPVYRHRGVDIARFLATGPDSPWAAIHVYRHRGATFIAIVASPPLDADE